MPDYKDTDFPQKESPAVSGPPSLYLGGGMPFGVVGRAVQGKVFVVGGSATDLVADDEWTSYSFVPNVGGSVIVGASNIINVLGMDFQFVDDGGAATFISRRPGLNDTLKSLNLKVIGIFGLSTCINLHLTSGMEENEEDHLNITILPPEETIEPVKKLDAFLDWWLEQPPALINQIVVGLG